MISLGGGKSMGLLPDSTASPPTAWVFDALSNLYLWPPLLLSCPSLEVMLKGFLATTCFS